ncbi:MAG: tetratricopeptide repeat protein [Planctomycetaceae bacterium]
MTQPPAPNPAPAKSFLAPLLWVMGIALLCALVTLGALILSGQQTESPDDELAGASDLPMLSASDLPPAPVFDQPAAPLKSETVSLNEFMMGTESSSLRSVAERLNAAETLLVEGDVAAAAIEIDSLIDDAREHPQQMRLSARAFLIAGLAHELSGDSTRSQWAYQEAFQRTDDTTQRACLILRLATQLQERDESPLAASMLLNLLMKHGRSLSKEMRGEQCVALATAMLGTREEAVSPKSILDLNTLHAPHVMLKPDHILDQWDAGGVNPPPEPPREFTMSRQRQIGTRPHQVVALVHCPGWPTEDVLEQVGREMGWTVRITDEARHRLRGHTTSLDTPELSLDTLLDGILLPLDVEWTHDGLTLQLMSSREFFGGVEGQISNTLQFAYRRRGTRYLQYALTQASDTSVLPVLLTDLARRAVVQGEYDQAIQPLQQIVSRGISGPEATVTWLNLGKCYLLANRRDEALEAMLHAADQMDGEVYVAAAYLFAGNIFLEDNQPDKAIPQLTRSMSIGRDELRGRAALLLSTAYLLQDEYTSASRVLWEAQDVIKLPPIDDQAAFLMAMIRFTASQPQEREYMGRNLLTAVTNVHQETMFSGTWDLLQIRAYRELGMIAECRELAQSFDIRNSGPGLHRLVQETVGDVVSLPASESSDSEKDTALQQRLSNARQLQLAGKLDEAIRACEELLSTESTSPEFRRELLKTLGHCYQSNGRHNEAIRCFVGISPQIQSGESALIQRGDDK